MSKYLSACFEELEPYVPGEQPGRSGCIKLNTNELPYPPSPLVQRAVAEQASQLNRYPDPTAADLMNEMARHFGVQPQNCFAGNGSDEVLAFCFQALCPGGAAFADLTYGFYPVYCALYEVDAKIIPLKDDFSLDIADYLGLGRTIFIANPNAPSGLALTLAEIEQVLARNPGSLVVVDEAYVDFGAQSAVPLLEKYDNLLVIGTFSKSRALAGARLGYAVGSEALVADMNRIKYSFNPYSLNRMTLAAGVAALQDDAYFEECRGKIIQTRERVTIALCEKGFVCTNSKTNFIFARHQRIGGKTLFDKLWEAGILVRRWEKDRIKDHLRISVGTDAEMDTMLAQLDKII